MKSFGVQVAWDYVISKKILIQETLTSGGGDEPFLLCCSALGVRNQCTHEIFLGVEVALPIFMHS